MNSRRLKRLVIDPATLGSIFVSGSKFQCFKGLPPTAVFLGASQNPEQRGLMLNLFFEDESFPEVEEGCEVPAIESPTIRVSMDREA